jgi:hypothetical protein
MEFPSPCLVVLPEVISLTGAIVADLIASKTEVISPYGRLWRTSSPFLVSVGCFYSLMHFPSGSLSGIKLYACGADVSLSGDGVHL